MLLTLDEKPGPDILALANRLAPGTPLLAVPTDSFVTAAGLFSLDGKLGAGTPRKAETALGLFETHVDTAELTDRLSVARSSRVTPMMFEHALLERARADQQRIVLPEGAEERILQAAEVLLRRGGARADAAGRGGRGPQEGRRPGHRARRPRPAHHRPADLAAAGAASPRSTPSCGRTRA